MPTATPIGGDPSTYSAATAGEFTPGQYYSYLEKIYRFVKNYTDNAIADGDVCVWQSASSYVITRASDASALGGATTAGGPCAGVGVGAIPTSYYGFILVTGRHTNVKGVATVTAYRKQKASATAASGTDATNLYDDTFGTAMTALSGGRYTVDVKV